MMRVSGRAVSAAMIVTALAATWVAAPPARGLGAHTEIAFQANTGELWTWKLLGGAGGTGLGMMERTSPSINPTAACCAFADHDIGFQANTGDLWIRTGIGAHNTGAGMAPGTSPSIYDQAGAFQADTGALWEWDGLHGLGSTGKGMMPGTSPSVDRGGGYAFQANTGNLWFSNTGDTGQPMMAGTSPSMTQVDDNAAFQGDDGTLWVWGDAAIPYGRQMTAESSPSMNVTGQIAIQTSDGELEVTLDSQAFIETGLAMAPGTSPSIDEDGAVAFQGGNNNLWIWKSDGSATGHGVDTGLGMMPETSPSISRDLELGEALMAAARGGDDGDDRLRGTSRNDLLVGLDGDDVIRARRGNDVIYGGPGDDVIHGGPGIDRVYAGPGDDRIVDHRGATTVTLESGAGRVDVRDGRGDDRVACEPGSTNRIRADRGDRVGRDC